MKTKNVKWKLYLVSTVGLIILSVFNSHLQAQDKLYFNSLWNNGYKIESNDKSFKLKFGGRIMWDNAVILQDDSLDNYFATSKWGSEFRRLRFFNSGTIYQNIKYKLQLDFAGGKISLKDVYIELKEIPLIHHLRMGHFKVPFRLEALTSSKYITFMERSLIIDFLPERNSGIMMYRDFAQKRLSGQFGVFFTNDNAGKFNNNSAYQWAARVSGLPVFNEEKSTLLHVGAGFVMKYPQTTIFAVVHKPESHLAPLYISTPAMSNLHSVQLLNLESAWVWKNFSLQAEFLNTHVKANADTNMGLTSYYAQVSYFITGESRKYKGSYEGFDRIKPHKNFGNGGAGAWELALRFSQSDLTNDFISGGILQDITLGVNWYLNPSTRMMLNYVHSYVKNMGKANIIQMRWQIDF